MLAELTGVTRSHRDPQTQLVSAQRLANKLWFRFDDSSFIKKSYDYEYHRVFCHIVQLILVRHFDSLEQNVCALLQVLSHVLRLENVGQKIN